MGTLVALQTLTFNIRDTLFGDIQARAGGDLVVSANFSNYYQRVVFPQAQKNFDNLQAQGKLGNWTGLNKHAIQITGYFNVPPTVYIVDPGRFPLYGKIDLLEPAGADFGKLLSEPNTIILSRSLFKAGDFQLGQKIEVSSFLEFSSPGGSSAGLKIVGVLDPVVPGINFDPGLFVGFGIVSQNSARAFLKEVEITPTTFFFKTTSAAGLADLKGRLQEFNSSLNRSFPYFAEVREAPEVLGEGSRNLEVAESIFFYIGLLATFIGGLGCINTMLVVVRRRTTEIATLKALGLKPRQALAIFTIEVMLLGALGSLVGLGLGSFLGFIMKSLVENLFSRPLNWSLNPAPLLTGLVVGTAVSVIFGFIPAFAAGKVPPAVVLRQQSGIGLQKLAGFSILVIVLALTTALGLLTGLLLGKVLLGMLAAFTVLVAGLLLITFMYLVVFLVGKLPAPGNQPSFKLALRNFNRQRVRTAATLLVISASLFFISLISILSDSIKTTLKETFDFNLGFNAGAVNIYSSQDQQLQARFEREIPGLQKIFISNQVGAAILAVNRQPLSSEVAQNDSSCGAFVEDTFNNTFRLKSNIQLSGRSLAGGESISPNGPQQILAGRNLTPADMEKKVLLISAEEAHCYNLQVGDKVSLALRSNNFGQGARRNNSGDYEVIGITSKGTAGTNLEQSFVVPFAAVNEAGANFSIFFMQIDPPYIKSALTQVQKSLYGNFVFDLTDLINTFSRLLDQLLAFPLLLSSLSLISGSVLIANNVALSIIERRAEVGVLKAIGARSNRVLAMLLWESSLVGLLGGLLGIGGSLAVASVIPALVKTGEARLNFLLTWSPLNGLLLLALGVGLAVLFTFTSAWHSIQEKPLVVLRYE